MAYVEELLIGVDGAGLNEITSQVAAIVQRAALRSGLVTVFSRHTSASLTIQENADPSAARDMEAWFNRLVPENDALYTHTAEGPDDMPAHIKSMLTDVSISIPLLDGVLALGTWQGIYLFEHRRHRGERRVVVSVIGQ
jgi:secondary thiamine-phosphate synthase enzyme